MKEMIVVKRISIIVSVSLHGKFFKRNEQIKEYLVLTKKLKVDDTLSDGSRRWLNRQRF